MHLLPSQFMYACGSNTQSWRICSPQGEQGETGVPEAQKTGRSGVRTPRCEADCRDWPIKHSPPNLLPAT